MKAIETYYKGYSFRSRLEARWAVFFENAGIRYEYESEGYSSYNGTKYLPDFNFPDLNIFAEVKGDIPVYRDDLRRIADFLESSPKCRGVMILTAIPEPKAVNKTSVYWFPFAYFDPLKNSARLTFVAVVQHISEVTIYAGTSFSRTKSVDLRDFSNKANYSDLAPIPDTEIANGETYPVMLSEFSSPILDNAFEKARRARFE